MQENLLNRTPLAHILRTTVNKLELVTLKSVCISIDTTIQRKRQPRDHDKIFNNYIFDRAIIFTIKTE